MKWTFIAMLVGFLVGTHLGRWDARHGEDAGLRAGKWVRGLLDEGGRDAAP